MMDKEPTQIKIKALTRLQVDNGAVRKNIGKGQHVWMPIDTALDLIRRELAVEVDRR